MNAGRVTTLPVRGQSVAELHGYFEQAHQALETLPGGFDVKALDQLHGKCALFATRLIRAPAATVDDILLKIEAAEWLGQEPLQTMMIIRDDLFRLKVAAP
jgi:hypothetical protein